MQIHVFLHGILRDNLPPGTKGRATIEMEDGATVAVLLESLDINRRVVVAINEKQEVDTNQILHNEDEVVIFTVISGGSFLMDKAN